MACSSCQCSPCQCAPCPSAVLNQPRIFGPIISGGQYTNGTFQSPTIVGGTSTSQSVIGATIDCSTIGCTQPQGTCNATLATTSFVCNAIGAAISAANPEFCNAVSICFAAASGATCVAVAGCIASTPGIINTVNAFGPLSNATKGAAGVTRYATVSEVRSAQCNVAMEPCELVAVWGSAPDGGAFWTAFAGAVNGVMGILDFCTLTAACGYAPLVSPALSGSPTAPTPSLGDNSNQIATTSFVQQAIGAINFCAATAGCGYVNATFVNTQISTAISTAVSASNPAFCAAVTACGGADEVIGTGAATFTSPGVVASPGVFVGVVFDNNGTISASGANARFTFSAVQPDTNYSVALSDNDQTGQVKCVIHAATTTHVDFNVVQITGASVFGVRVDITISR